jgi:predicted transcriptional regulator
MNTIRFIRTKVFSVTQADFAAIAAVGQASISRWENGDGDPSLAEMRNIREAARERGLEFQDEWFFQIPAHALGDEHVRSLVRSAVGTDGGGE